jgi:hypothetical protein
LCGLNSEQFQREILSFAGHTCLVYCCFRDPLFYAAAKLAAGATALPNAAAAAACWLKWPNRKERELRFSTGTDDSVLLRCVAAAAARCRNCFLDMRYVSIVLLSLVQEKKKERGEGKPPHFSGIKDLTSDIFIITFTFACRSDG